jgi:signal transduction histidine kinase
MRLVRIPQWRAYRPSRRDAVTAACLTLVGQVVTWGRLEEQQYFHGPRAVNAVLSLLVTGSFAWRRRAPLAVVSFVVVVFCLSEVFVHHDVTMLAGFVPLIVLTASAGYHCNRRDAVTAAAVALVGLFAVVLSADELRSIANVGYDSAFLLAPWLACRGIRERENRAAALAADLERERAHQEVARREVLTAERVRIARELHDIVAHSVSVMVIQLGAARLGLRAGSEAAEPPLLAAEDVGRQALAELRRLLGVLRAEADSQVVVTEITPSPPQPGLHLIPALIDTARATGVDVRLDTVGTPVELSLGLNVTVYRIVQEGLTNVLKHARATHVDIRLAFEATHLDITLTNDGDGARDGSGGDGHGLIGIRERAALFGGTTRAGARRTGGWELQARLPLAGDHRPVPQPVP